MTKRWMALALTTLLVLTAGAQVSVKMQLDTADILIGEQVQLTTVVDVAKGKKVGYPPIEERGTVTPGVEVVGVGKIDTAEINGGKRWVLTRKYMITSFDSALYYIPPFAVTVDGKTYQSASRVGLKVNTVPVDTTHVEKFNGPVGVVDADFEWNPWFVALLLWFVLSLVLIYLWRNKRKKGETILKKVVIPAKLPAHNKALEKIEQLKLKYADKEEEIQSYYDGLTEALREYIQERFGVSTWEMTSREIIAALTENQSAAANRELQEILQTADIVKFANQKVGTNEQGRNLMQAIDYIQETKDTAVPEEEVKVVMVEDKAANRKQRVWKAVWLVLVAQAVVLLGYFLYWAYTLFI